MSAALLAAGARAATPAGDGAALVDRLAAADGGREAVRYARYAVRADSDLSLAFAPTARDHAQILDHPTIYAVEAKLTPGDVPTLDIRQTALWTNRSEGAVDRLVLRVLANGDAAGQVRIRKALVNGAVAEPWLRGTTLTVPLATPARPGETVRLFLDVTQAVPRFAITPSWDGPVNAVTVGSYGTHAGVVNLGGWLPLVVPLSRSAMWDDASLPGTGEFGWYEPSLFDVWMDLPPGWELATTGVELSRSDTSTRRRIHAVASAAREFAVEAAPDRAVTVTEAAGVRIRVMHAAEHPQIGRDLARVAERAMTLFAERFGPLPIAELDVVDAPVNVALGNEYPGLVTVDTHHHLYGTYQRSRYNEWTLAHEVAHQWWSGEVGSDPRSAPWLDEALAAWSASLFWRKEHGSVAVDIRHREDVLRPYAEMHALGIGDLPANLPAGSYNLTQYAAIVYGRAPLWFDELVAAIGDEEVYAALQAYYASNHCRRATATDLMGSLRASTDRPQLVDELYQRWIVEAHGYEDLIAPGRPE